MYSAHYTVRVYTPQYYNGSVSTCSLLASVSIIILCYTYTCRDFQSTVRKFPFRLQLFSIYENNVLAVVIGNRNNYRHLARVCQSILRKQWVCLPVYRKWLPAGIAFWNFEYKWLLPFNFRSWKQIVKISISFFLINAFWLILYNCITIVQIYMILHIVTKYMKFYECTKNERFI